MSLTRRQVLKSAAVAGAALMVPVQWAAAPALAATPRLKKWVDALVVPPVVSGTQPVSLSIVTATHSFHRDLGSGSTLAYQSPGAAATYLGPTIVVTTGEQTTVTATNQVSSHPLAASLDLDVHGTRSEDAQQTRTAVHLHGGNTAPPFDGGPLDTFPVDHMGQPVSNTYPYTYDNSQDAAGIWCHDHALGITRLNVYAGLAAGYLIRDTSSTGIDTGDGSVLPPPPYEVPLIIQDKTFNADGSMFYDPSPWVPEFFGATPVVNGKAYPFMTVAQGVYRFRVYNGSNARFYRINLKVKSTGAKMTFWQIGGDGGLLNAPVPPHSAAIRSGRESRPACRLQRSAVRRARGGGQQRRHSVPHRRASQPQGRRAVAAASPVRRRQNDCTVGASSADRRDEPQAREPDSAARPPGGDGVRADA